MLETRSGAVSLSHVAVMGILNATPDSFSDGGAHLDPARAADAAARMVAEGAALLDVGAESTRPGAEPVLAVEERRRLLPVLRAIRAAVRVPIAVDTTKAEVAAAALDAGADLVNDVSAGRFDPELLRLCAAARGVLRRAVRSTHRPTIPSARMISPSPERQRRDVPSLRAWGASLLAGVIAFLS